MRPLGFLKADKLVVLLNWVGIPVSALYIVCMFAAPWFQGNWSWVYVQSVWDRWQSVNVGMLAFVSSLIAFNIAKFNAGKQRERKFAASKAFLPAALSELVTYFKESAAVFKLGWEAQAGIRPGFASPTLLQGYRDVFIKCIQHAEPEVGEYLSRILMQMQIHDARLREYIRKENDESQFAPQKHNLITYFYQVAKLQALVGKLFNFARGLEPFDSNDLEWEDFRNAFLNLNVWAEDIEMDYVGTLAEFTKRAIARNASQGTQQIVAAEI